ncbi:hypothetical protein C1J05_04310 [Sulfitobacter sp. JL08]|nr:hypothetical protein C1J05_04310 [Sulfitobacter sp. JL08]
MRPLVTQPAPISGGPAYPAYIQRAGRPMPAPPRRAPAPFQAGAFGNFGRSPNRQSGLLDVAVRSRTNTIFDQLALRMGGIPATGGYISSKHSGQGTGVDNQIFPRLLLEGGFWKGNRAMAKWTEKSFRQKR